MCVCVCVREREKKSWRKCVIDREIKGKIEKIKRERGR